MNLRDRGKRSGRGIKQMERKISGSGIKQMREKGAEEESDKVEKREKKSCTICLKDADRGGKIGRGCRSQIYISHLESLKQARRCSHGPGNGLFYRSIQMYVNARPLLPEKAGGLREEVTGMKGEQTSDNKQTIGRRGARDPGTKDRGAYTERNCVSIMTHGKGKITTF
jgi:hypothetical protein